LVELAINLDPKRRAVNFEQHSFAEHSIQFQIRAGDVATRYAEVLLDDLGLGGQKFYCAGVGFLSDVEYFAHE
jgi:hypothetical protein